MVASGGLRCTQWLRTCQYEPYCFGRNACVVELCSSSVRRFSASMSLYASFALLLLCLAFEGFGHGTERGNWTRRSRSFQRRVGWSTPKTLMAAVSTDNNEVFLTVVLPADIGTREWRLQCLREAEGVRDVVVEEDRVRCGPFVLGDEAAVPPLLYAFACAAADASEGPVVTFDEAEDCLAFLQAVAQRRPGAAAAAANTIAAVERSISDSAPLPEEHRAVHETPVIFPEYECRDIRAIAEKIGLVRGARHAAHATTDVSCLDEKVLRWVAGACIERVVPRLAEAFGYGSDIVSPDLVLADLFVARYSADGQRALEEHEDGRDAVSSSNLASMASRSLSAIGHHSRSSCRSTMASRAAGLSS